MPGSDWDWLEALVRNGHEPAYDFKGELDTCFLAQDFHNGPGCTACHETWCMHCYRPGDVGPCTEKSG